MEDIIASVADIYFDIEFQLANQVGCQPLPFPGMDSTVRMISFSSHYNSHVTQQQDSNC